MPTPLDRPHKIPPEVALRGRYILLAIAAHVLLFVALGMNMQWRSEAPPPAMAELWVELPPHTPLVNPEPQQPTPRPEPTPTPPPVKEDPRVVDAQIALEQTRRQAAEAERLRLAQEETLRQQAAEKEKQEAAKRERLAAEEKARQLKAEEKRRAEEQKQREEAAERERSEAEEKARQLKAEEERKAEEQKQREAAERRRIQAERDAAERERIRREQLASIEGALGGSGNSNTGPVGPTGGTGTSSHLAYTNRLAGIVKRNITYTGDTAGNPEARVYVETDQNGRITVVRLTRSSGNALWDDTVVKAIWKTGQFPADTNNKRPDTKFDFKLKPLD